VDATDAASFEAAVASFNRGAYGEGTETESPSSASPSPSSSSCVDLVTCFSTTMWVHVNHGDVSFYHSDRSRALLKLVIFAL
jgi:hypothetical protein